MRRTTSSRCSCSAPGRTSSIGVTRGGLPTILSSPSTVRHSFVSARMLSFVRTLATVDWRRFICLPEACRAGRGSTRRRGARTRRRCSASPRSAPSPRGTRAPPPSRPHGGSRRSKSRSRPATARLAASRFTSHSNGPGSVSSKSLRLKTSLRSGAAKMPKFERCASPQSWACSPVRGPSARSAAIR